MRDEAGVDDSAHEVKERVPNDVIVDTPACKGAALGSAHTADFGACWLDVCNTAPLAAREAAHKDREPPKGGKQKQRS